MAFIFIQLTSLVFLAGYTIKDAESTRWKSANIGIVMGSMLGGMVLAFVIGYIGHNEDFGMVEALPFSLITGFIGAGGAIVGNKWRAGGIRKGPQSSAHSERQDRYIGQAGPPLQYHN